MTDCVVCTCLTIKQFEVTSILNLNTYIAIAYKSASCSLLFK